MSTGADPVPTKERAAVVAAQKQQFGGIKWGSAFFGWLTATGTALLLTALAAVAFGLATTDGAAGRVIDEATRNPDNMRTAGITGAVVLVVVLFLAYFCGGYVAGRMARFNGVRQGIAVWLWAIAVAAVAAMLGVVAGARFDVLATLDGLPRLPIDEGTVTAAGIMTALLALVASLVGAALGGVAGMRFHRRVDRAGFDQQVDTRDVDTARAASA